MNWISYAILLRRICNMKSKDEMNKLLYKLYDLYIYDEEINKPNQTDEIKEAYEKVEKLNTEISNLYMQHEMDQYDFGTILDELYDAYDILIQTYRKHDFMQGLMIGLSLNKLSQEYVTKDEIDKWLNQISIENERQNG